MRDLKKINYFQLGLIMLFALFLAACTCPPSPNPLIAIKDGGISITADTVADATTVFISSFDGSGHALDTITTTPGQELVFQNNSDIPRPIRFRFVYKSASGNTIVEDVVSVEDGEDNGVLLPDMDVVIGRLANTQSCPSTTEIATGTGEVIFTFQPNIRYEIRMTHPGGTEEKLILQAAPPPNNEQAGKVTVYKNDSYPTCLTGPAASNPNNLKQLEVSTVQSTHCKITGLDSVSTDYPVRQIKIKCSTNTCSIKVRKE